MLRKVVDYANVTVSVLIGLYVVLLTLFRTDALKSVPSGLVAGTGSIIMFFLIAGGLVAVNIWLLVKEWKAGGLRRNLRITTDHGMIELSVAAMEMQLLRDLRAEPDIMDPAVGLTAHGEGKPMLCQLEIKLRRQEDVVKRIDAIKRKVRDILDRLVPGGLTVEVMVEVRDFVGNDSLRYPARPSAGEAIEFNGPVYSDAGGSDSV